MLVRARNCSIDRPLSGLATARATGRMLMARTVGANGRHVFAFLAHAGASRASFLRIDAIDRKILAELQLDGRVTLTDLAERIPLSVSRCQRRVRELERTGVIRGYHALVDPAALGFGFEVLVFATLLRPDMVTDFDEALLDVPQVVEA